MSDSQSIDRELTERQRENVAMYLMSRADQYETDSPCWVALSDAAHNIINGAIDAELAYNGDDLDMRRRVRSWKDCQAAQRPVVSNAGVER